MKKCLFFLVLLAAVLSLSLFCSTNRCALAQDTWEEDDYPYIYGSPSYEAYPYGAYPYGNPYYPYGNPYYPYEYPYEGPYGYGYAAPYPYWAPNYYSYSAPHEREFGERGGEEREHHGMEGGMHPGERQEGEVRR